MASEFSNQETECKEINFTRYHNGIIRSRFKAALKGSLRHVLAVGHASRAAKAVRARPTDKRRAPITPLRDHCISKAVFAGRCETGRITVTMYQNGPKTVEFCENTPWKTF